MEIGVVGNDLFTIGKITLTNVFTESPSPAVFCDGWYGPEESPQ